ncbi:MAG: cofactor-independent phosphoglycerate mutase [Desulfonatronovibrio sp.]
MTKVLMLVADGMGDWPLEDLQGRTPLQAAFTPNMDFLASRSRVGTCQTIPDNQPPGSDIANMALMGYDPARYHTGRGPIEAAAQGLTPGPQDLIWRCNLVSLDSLQPGAKMLDYSAGHIESQISRPFIDSLQDRLGSDEFTFYPGVQYRHLVVQKKGSLSAAAKVNIRPPHDILDQAIDQDLREFQSYPPLWDLVQGSYRVLKDIKADSKADSIWPWGQGLPLTLPSFQDRFGLGGAVISAVDLIRGLGRAAGLEALIVPGVTGLLDTNYQGKVQAAQACLEHDDFVFVHLEGPDECGHMGSIPDKIEAISRFDRLIVGPLLDSLGGQDFIMIICCDHFTPIKLRTHARDPVPFLIYNSRKQSSGPQVFSEASAGETGLTIDQGHKLLDFALADCPESPN